MEVYLGESVVEISANQEFLTWAAEHGIGLPRGYSEILDFISGESDSRFWMIPFEPIECLLFMTVLLDTIDNWEYLWAYTNHDTWISKSGDYRGQADQVLDTLLRWSGIPTEFTGSVRYDRSDRANLVLLMIAAYQFGFHGFHELFFVPDHGQQFLWLDHEAAIFVFFADKSKIDPFVTRMEAAGFYLPKTAPSGFRAKHWMVDEAANEK